MIMLLNKFQKKFKETMFQPADQLRDCIDDFADVFEESDIPIHDRLKVYHNNVIGSISASLCATFPLIENLTGEDFLKSMVRSFIFKHPPRSGCLHLYGTGFDSFIKTYEPAKTLPYLPDIATLELALNAAYYAKDNESLAQDALAQVPPEKLGDTILDLRPSATLVSSIYPLEQIRDFCLDEKKGDSPDISKKYMCRILILRPKLDVQIIPLKEDEFMMLKLLNEKTALGASLEKTLEAFPTFDFTTFLHKHTSLETFSTLQTNKCL